MLQRLSQGSSQLVGGVHASFIQAVVDSFVAAKGESYWFPFPELQYCEIHNRLVECVLFRQINSGSKADANSSAMIQNPRDTECTICPLPAFRELEIREPKGTLTDCEELWLTTYKEDVKAMTHGESVEWFIRERQAWIDYSYKAWDACLKRRVAMVKAKEANTPIKQVDALLRDYDQESRYQQHFMDRKGSDKLFKISCSMHKGSIGDLLPFRSITRYQECAVCEVPKVREPKKPLKQSVSWEQINTIQSVE